MPGGGIFCSMELPLFFDRSGVGGGGFFVQRNCLWFLRFFGTNSGQFFERNVFVFEKFWFWGTYPANPGGGEMFRSQKKSVISLCRNLNCFTKNEASLGRAYLLACFLQNFISFGKNSVPKKTD